MPRTTKEAKTENLNKEETVAKSAKAKASSTTKKATKTTTSKVKKTTTKASSSKSNTSTKSTKKKSASSTVSKKSSSTTTKKASTKKSTTKATKSTTRKTRSTKSVKKLEENIVAEYYDLPYRYNETIVKILYQTPNVLFVYWDISDYDRNKFINEYGENFFNNTVPVLKVFNLTKNYSFEIEINDFANSWYIHVNDANCEYKVELGRKTIKYEENIHNDYLYISSSNDIEFPNDHILLDELPSKVNFRNVKTNEIHTKDISTLRLIGINKIYKVYDFYKRFFKDELLEDLNTNKKIINTSSSSSSWN